MSATTTVTEAPAAAPAGNQLNDAITALLTRLQALSSRVPKSSEEVAAWLREIKEVASSSEGVFARLTTAVRSVGDSATFAAIRTPVISWVEWTKAQATAIEARVAELATRRGDEAVHAARAAASALRAYAEAAGQATASHVPSGVATRVRVSTAALRTDVESLVAWARSKAPTELLANASTALTSAGTAVKARIADPAKLRDDAHAAAQWAATLPAAARTAPALEVARARSVVAARRGAGTLARAYVWVFSIISAAFIAILAWARALVAVASPKVEERLGAKRTATIKEAAATLANHPAAKRVTALGERAAGVHTAILSAAAASPVVAE